jgi:hypothetical protein
VLARPGKKREGEKKKWGVAVTTVVLNPTHGGGGRADGVAPRGRRTRGGAWTGPARRSVGEVGRQRPEAGGRGRRGAALPCSRSEQGRATWCRQRGAMEHGISDRHDLGEAGSNG